MAGPANLQRLEVEVESKSKAAREEEHNHAARTGTQCSRHFFGCDQRCGRLINQATDAELVQRFRKGLPEAGWLRIVDKIVTDQQSPAQDIVALGQLLTENVTVGTPNDLGIVDVQIGMATTQGNGRYSDTLQVCSTACPNSIGVTVAVQTISDAYNSGTYTLAPNTFLYSCTGNTINGQ